jgi:hypothetical protein
MSAALPDEYQDGLSEGSLGRARRCWLDLTAAGSLKAPQRFTFTFQSAHSSAPIRPTGIGGRSWAPRSRPCGR